MLNYDNFAITFGRAIETFRARPEAVDEHKAALRALVALTRLGGVTLALSNERLVVCGRWIAPTLPGIGTLVAQMDLHDVREIRIERDASPADLLHLLRSLASGLGSFADGRGLGERLRDSGVDSVAVLTVRATAPPVADEPPAGVTAAFASEDARAALAEAIGGTDPAPLAAVIADLALDPTRADVLDRATAAAQLAQRELEGGGAPAALAAASELVRLEGRLPEGSPRRSLAIVLNRLLARPLLQAAAERSREPATAEAARLVLRRGGGDATDVLLERLVQGQTIGERRHYFDLLRLVADGVRQVILMLGHPQWFAVRNVAELLGELRVAEAVGPLARALRHPDGRVRRAAALALARIGTTEALEHIGGLLRDADPELRLAVAAAIGGREMGSLTGPLVLAVEGEHDGRVMPEYYRALGRIGSPAAVEVLVRAAVGPGWRWWRRRRGRRLAAIEGLKLAGGSAAISTLEGLLKERDREIRRAVREALEDLDVL